MKKGVNNGFLKTLGPGILFASTAIGVSHLVQSTRAGAMYGLGLLWAVVLANLMKYPFFEFGSRYANVTGISIIDGYRSLGRGYLWIYIAVVLSSMFFVCAAVTAVTAGFFDLLFGISGGEGGMVVPISAALLMLCGAILFLGRYKALDSLIKVVALVLFITTIAAFILALIHGPVDKGLSIDFKFPGWGTDMAFLIALMGWMPTAVDLSAWNSLWTIERMNQTGYRPQLKETLLDFNIGYVVSGLLAVMFLVMGAFLFNGTGTELSNSAAGFAGQVIGMFTDTIGDWSYFIVSSSAFAIMLGTTIAVLDGYSRAVERSMLLIKEGLALNGKSQSKSTYAITLMILAAGAFGVVYFFGSSLSGLVDLATTISFLIAPFIAAMNFYLVKSDRMGPDHRLPYWMSALAYAGLLYLVVFSVLFLLNH